MTPEQRRQIEAAKREAERKRMAERKRKITEYLRKKSELRDRQKRGA